MKTKIEFMLILTLVITFALLIGIWVTSIRCGEDIQPSTHTRFHGYVPLIL
jgi:hypothetical protein